MNNDKFRFERSVNVKIWNTVVEKFRKIKQTEGKAPITREFRLRMRFTAYISDSNMCLTSQDKLPS